MPVLSENDDGSGYRVGGDYSDSCEFKMTDTYNQIIKQECEWCAKGWTTCCRSESTGKFHQPPGGGLHQPCTAPTKDAAIDRLTAALERARKDIYDAPHGLQCPKRPGACRIPGRNPDCNCWKRDALAALESKEQNAE